MANPLYSQTQTVPQTQPNNIINAVRQLQQTFSGNPQQEVEKLMRSGRISQEQYNNAVQKANQLMQFFR